jgi:L-fuconolactonase
MAIESIIDTHLHLWDTRTMRYPWLDSIPVLNRPYLLGEYQAAIATLPVECMVFVQCEAEFSQYEVEAAWVAEQARIEPRIRGLVAWAPLEKGAAVREDLIRLKRHAILRGIRRIIQFEPDLDFCLRPEFIAGVRALREFDLSFDICIDYRHMENVLKFVERVGDIPMVLDHIGKPSVRSGLMHPWAEQLRELARFPNVSCKISGVATEADHQHWTQEDLKPYIDVAIEAFGFGRVMFAADWPVATQAISYRGWVDLLDNLLAGVDGAARRQFWCDNAARFYRVG